MSSVPSSMSDFIFNAEDQEGFPSPSEKDKLKKAIERAEFIIGKFGNRPDIIEEKFHLADLLVGRGHPGDYERAGKIYDEILSIRPYPYLKARCLIGKAELAIPEIKKEQIPTAIDLVRSALEILHKLPKEEQALPSFPFFRNKAVVIEAELCVTRDEGKDHDHAQKLYEGIIKDRKSHWYFRARAELGKAELLSFHFPKKTGEGIKLAERAAHLMKNRPHDYFSQKALIIEAELRINRGKSDDIKKAQNSLNDLLKRGEIYPDLAARAKLNLVQISKHPKAQKLFDEVQEMEGLDPYIIKKSKQIRERFF